MITNEVTNPSLSTTDSPVPKNQKLYEEAIKKGKDVLANGGSKADAARAIFDLLESEDREVIILAFITGASLTPKGSPTYFYNISRQRRKTSKVKPSKKG